MSRKNRWGSLLSGPLALLTLSALFFSPAIAGEPAAGDGKVRGISGREIEISLGQADGISIGTQLKVLRNKEIKRGDHVLRIDTINIAEIEIVKVQENSSMAKMLRSYRSVQEEDIVILTQPIAKKQPVEEIVPTAAPVSAPEPEPALASAPEPVVEAEAKAEPEPEPEPAPEAAPVAELEAEPVVKEPAIVEVDREPEPEPEAKPIAAVEPEPTPAEPEAAAKVVEETKVNVFGSLDIKTKPSEAEILLEGKSIGTSPKTILEQHPGTYKVKLTKEGYYTKKVTVQVSSGQTSEINIKLKRFEGDLRVNSMPKGANLLVDGKPKGKTNTRVYLKPGSHIISIQKAGYKQLKKKINVSGNSPVTLNLVMEKHGAPDVEGMIYISGGEFIMGSDSGNPNEKPARTVTIDGFYIDKYEVTNAQFRKFVEATGHIEPAFWNDEDLSKPNHPVVGVSWEDAAAYAKWAGKRLPTEAEWEKAARGFDGRNYPWGDEYKAGYANKFGPADGHKFTAPVNSYSKGASPYGALNMAGNVWEWCDDWYKGSPSGELKVMRGGSWEDSEKNLRTSNRSAETVKYYNYNLGFRCAK